MNRHAGREHNALLSRIHEVELGLSLHKLLFRRVSPDSLHGISHSGVDLCLSTSLDAVLKQEVAIRLVLLDGQLDIKLAHGVDNGLGALDQVLEDGRAVVVEFIVGIAFEMDDLHLLDNGGLATFTRTCRTQSDQCQRAMVLPNIIV